MIRNAMAWFCSALVVCSPVWAQTPEGDARYQLVVVRGEDAQNNIKKGRATKAVVEVRDRNRKPVAGIAVLFTLPDSGPSGVFVSGSTSTTVTTDSLGQAAVTYKPNNVPGQFNLKASAKGAENDVNAKQSNSAGTTTALSTTAIVVLILAAAVGVGLGVGLTRDGGSSRVNTVTLTPGGAVVGPPK